MSDHAAADAADDVVSDELQQLWVDLATQLSPFNAVIIIQGHVFTTLDTSSCIWLADQYQ